MHKIDENPYEAIATAGNAGGMKQLDSQQNPKKVIPKL